MVAAARPTPPTRSGAATQAAGRPDSDCTPPLLVLASTSPYRRALLERLRLPFETLAPEVDERPRDGETPADLAVRLALAKARAGARLRPAAWVIGSDQVADLDGQPLGKPGDHAGALDQWRRMRGRVLHFHTAVAVAAPHDARAAASGSGPEDEPRIGHRLVSVTVGVRAVTDEAIERYLRLEQPYDCAGSAKCEGLGIAMLDRVSGDDPTALVGLPLIATCALLRESGYEVMAWAR